jgi:hypothetical protein
MIKRADWLAIGRDRTAILLLLGLGILVITIIILTLVRIHISDIQVPARFTGYGQNNIYRDHWYAQLGYSGFAILVGLTNAFLAIKIYKINRVLSLGFLSLSLLVMILGIIIMNAIFNLTPVV